MQRRQFLTVRQAQKASGVDKIHAIVGGFHLAPAPDATVAKTVAAFKAINPDYVIPMHCTGINTIMAVHREMPAKLVMPSTGTRVIFGASRPSQDRGAPPYRGVFTPRAPRRLVEEGSRDSSAGTMVPGLAQTISGQRIRTWAY